jgi:lysozyme family protein
MIDMAQAVDQVIGVEGAYSNNPNDSGGETMWGITLDTARRYGYAGPMAAMPKSEAARIYIQHYIVGVKLDQVWSIADRIAYELFDSGVNCGSETAIKWLQTGLNALNKQGKDFADMTVDGHIGPQTLQALKVFLTLRKLDGEIVLLKVLNVLQGAHYLTLGVERPKDEDFIYGWFKTRIDLPAR